MSNHDKSLTTTNTTIEEKDEKDVSDEKSWWPISPPWKTPEWMKNQKVYPHSLK